MTPEQVTIKGKEIYKLLPDSFIQLNKDRFILIDIGTGDHEVAEPNGIEIAASQLLRKHPDAVIFLGRIGRDHAVHLGGVSSPTW